MGVNINELNNLQLDVLREIGNIGSGNAVTALAKLINRKVDMDVPKIKILEFNKVNEILGEPELIVVGISLKFQVTYRAAYCLLWTNSRQGFW